MSESLFWRSLPYRQQRFFVRGTELSAAIVPGTLSRFAIYETRCHDAAGMPDRYYRVRDAETVTDDEIRAGKQARIVGPAFADPDAAVAWVHGKS